MTRVSILLAILLSFLVSSSASAQDADADGVLDDVDNCPSAPNPDQANADGDFLGDACDDFDLDPRNDSDGDGEPNGEDNCPGVANADQVDGDVDGVGDACDGCPSTSDPLQLDSNADGINDACQCGDADGDGDLDWDDAVRAWDCHHGLASCDLTIVDADANNVSEGQVDADDLVAYLDHLEVPFYGYVPTFRSAGSFTCQRRPAVAEHRLPTTIGIGGGVVHGSALGSAGDVVVFNGIAYTAPPAPDGSSRWRAPDPHPGFGGAEVDATKLDEGAFAESWHCPQRFGGASFGKEDCVRLFVHAPRDLADAEGRLEKKPVVVMIHGGAFIGQNSARSFEALARNLDAVFVGLNYRLGVFGFLATPALQAESPYGSSGNYALEDLIVGLEWVQQNVHRFGGDPERVTIFGNSAGGALSSLLLASPLAQGLFRSVVSTSSPLMPGPLPVLPIPPDTSYVGTKILRHPFERAISITSGVGCTAASGAAELACLRAADASDLLLAAEAQTHRVVQDRGLAEFYPVVDHHVLIDQPSASVASGIGSDVALMIGAAADEGKDFNAPGGLTEFDWWWKLFVITQGNGQLATALDDLYLGGAGPATDADRKSAYDALTGELTFMCPSLRFAHHAALAPARTAPVYALQYDHVMRDAEGAPLKGALHNHAIAYLLDSIEETFLGDFGPILAGGSVELTATDYLLQSVMHSAFTGIVRYAEAWISVPFGPWPEYTSLDDEDADIMVFDGHAPGLDPYVVSRPEAEVRDGRCAQLVGLGLVN